VYHSFVLEQTLLNVKLPASLETRLVELDLYLEALEDYLDVAEIKKQGETISLKELGKSLGLDG